jgi:hypothetical protein
MLKTIGIFTFLIFNSSFLFAQSRQSPIIMKDTKCEENAAMLDGTVSGLKEGSSIIAVARLGNSEKSAIYNLRRLKVIKDFISLTKYSKLLVTAQGERIKGRGRVEIYMNGILGLVFELSRNKKLMVGNCGY